MVKIRLRMICFLCVFFYSTECSEYASACAVKKGQVEKASFSLKELIKVTKEQSWQTEDSECTDEYKPPPPKAKLPQLRIRPRGRR